MVRMSTCKHRRTRLSLQLYPPHEGTHLHLNTICLQSQFRQTLDKLRSHRKSLDMTVDFSRSRCRPLLEDRKPREEFYRTNVGTFYRKLIFSRTWTLRSLALIYGQSKILVSARGKAEVAAKCSAGRRKILSRNYGCFTRGTRAFGGQGKENGYLLGEEISSTISRSYL